MTSEDTKKLEFNQQQKSDKAPFIINEGVECLLEKIDGCKGNLRSLQQETYVGMYVLLQVFQYLQYCY